MRLSRLGALGALVLAGGCSSSDRVGPVDGIALVEPGTVDFGRVALGATRVREVRVRNTGLAPLHLLELSIEGLGQDVEIVNRGDGRLRPGAETVLELRYTPAAEELLARTLTMDVDDRVVPTVDIPVVGIAQRPQIVPEPAALDFGRIELGVPERRTLALRNDFELPVEVALVQEGDPRFQVPVAGTLVVPALSTRELELTFLPDRAGPAEGALRMLPCPLCAEVTVPMVGVGLDRALLVEPPLLDFGNVPIDRLATRPLTLTNDSTHPLEVFSVATDPAHPAFDTDGLAVRLAPGTSVQLPVRFGPTRLGLDESALEVRTSSVREPTSRVVLRGIGGGPEIAVVPGSVDFGEVPEGGLQTRAVRITNVGADPSLPKLLISGVTMAGSPEFRSGFAAPIELGPGEFFDLELIYEPLGAGADAGEATIASNDGSSPEVRVPLSGRATVAPPCSLALSPAALDFGTLDLRRGAVLGFTLRNTGATLCVLRDLRIAPGSDPAFRMPGVPPQGVLLSPGGWFGRMVAFDPLAVNAGAGDYTGEVEVWIVENGARRRMALPLSATSAPGCLVPTPRFLDFASGRPECGPRSGTVSFTNVCPGGITVGSIAVGAGNNPGEFSLDAAPASPFFLGAGDDFEVDLTWRAATRGPSYAPLYVAESGRVGPLMVPLLGSLHEEGARTDVFTQHRADAVDVLLVVDNSSSMAEEQARIATAVGTLFDVAAARGIDLRVAVTTTGLVPSGADPQCPGGVDGGEAGRFFPVDRSRPRIVTPATPDARNVLAANTQVGLCHYLEQGMEAMRLALSAPLVKGENAGFLRQEARLAVIFVSEEDDHSGFPVQEYAAFLAGLKGAGGAVTNAIVDVDRRCTAASGVAVRYLELVAATGGVSSSICAGNWAPAFRAIADRSYTPETGFPLAEVPDAAGVVVHVDGVLASPSSWVFDAAANEVRFHVPPPPGARIEIDYTPVCN